MKIVEYIVLQPRPRRNRDASFSDVDAAMESDLELEPGPGARTEARIPLAYREPAHVRHREASYSSGDRAVRPRVPELSSPMVSYRSDEVNQVMLLGRKPSNPEADPRQPLRQQRTINRSGTLSPMLMRI